MPVNIPAGFSIANADPIDARLIVANQSERLSFSAANIYEGMVVYQEDDNALYVLVDPAQRTVNAGWTLISSGSSSGTPGGTDTNVQFNSGSIFTGSANLTFNYTTNTLSGTTAQFTTISGSTISSSNFVGNGSSLANLTASNITNFTNDVRAQFTPGTNITIVGGVISSTGGGGGTPGGADTQVQFNSGSTFSGSSNLTYNYTTNTLSGTTAQFTTVSGSNVSSSNFVGNGSSITNLTASNITNFTNDTRNQFTPGTNITIVGGVISSTGGATTPGGVDTTIQFNSGSVFSGSTNLVYDYTNNILSGTTARFTAITSSIISASSTIQAGGAITGSGGLNISGGPTTIAGGVGQNLTVSTSLQVTGPTPTFSNAITASGGISGSTAQFTSISGSTITGSIISGSVITGSVITSSNFVGNGSNIANITASNITNFTNDVRSRFSAGTGIVINAGVISASNVPNSSLQNSSITIGTTAVSLGTTASTIQGLTELTSSNLSASSILKVGGAITGSGGLNISGGPTTLGGGAGQNVTISTGLVVSGPTPTFSNPITASGGITGSTAQFTTISGSTVTGSTARFTIISGSTVTGSTARFTIISGSTVTGSQIEINGPNLLPALSVNGYVTNIFTDSTLIGVNSSDTISFQGSIASDIIPLSDNTIDLGSTSKRIGNIYADKLYTTSSLGRITIGTGSNDSLIEIATPGGSTYRGIRILSGSTEKWFAGVDNNNDYVLRTDGSDRFQFFEEGRLQIIQTTNTNTSGLYFSSGSVDWYVYVNSTNDLYFQYEAGANGGFISDTVAASQMNFTGQHRNVPDPSEEVDLFLEENEGLIVVSTGNYNNVSAQPNNKPTINESLPKIKLSNIRNQKSVFGVIAEFEDPEKETREWGYGAFRTYMTKQDLEDNRIIVNAVGEGAIWVCNINGNLENGDYITTCEIPGHGMKQDDDLLHNYTVAKITQNCSFELDNPNYDCVEFQFSGSTYRKAFVGCTYHCG